MRIGWALACLALAWTLPVAAQTPDSSEEAEESEIVVVGSRAAPRLATDSAVPVDVIPRDELSDRGDVELTRALQFLSPSVNFLAARPAPRLPVRVQQRCADSARIRFSCW